MLSSKKSLEFFCIQFQLHFSQRTISRVLGAIVLIFFSLSTHALTIDVPEYSEDGNYSISWSGGRYSTKVRELLKDGALSIISDKTSGTYSVTGKAPGVYTYSFEDCYITASQTPSLACEAPIYKTVYVSPSEPLTSIANKEITPYNYDVYKGDLNGDGKSDYYFDGKKQIILLHGDIAIPVTILPPPSFIVMKDGNNYLSPELLKLTASQISAKVTANQLRKGQINSDFYIWSDGVSGQSKVLMRGSTVTEPSLLLVSSASTQTPSIGQVFQPNSYANLSNYSLAIGFNDFNRDGRKDLSINGYTYLSNSSGTIDANPVIKFTSPSSVKVGLDFITGSPWISWSAVYGAAQYEIREMLNAYPTGLQKTVTTLSAGFGVLTQLGTYTYEVRACKISNGVSNCSDWASSSGVKSKLSEAPLIYSPISNASGNYNVSWNRVTGATRYELYENNTLIQNTNDLVKVFGSPNAKLTGYYSYQVRACKDAVCGPLSNISATTVSRTGSSASSGIPNTQIQKSSELTTGIVDSFPIMEIPTDAPVGTLDGQFRVNESGAATYSISVATADGVAGVTPRISFGYSSQNGNGLLGKGWNINGLSGITRCRQTVSQDGKAASITWSSSDRFCLDGQRLMLVSGVYGSANSTYKTEIDTFVTVTAKGGSAGNPDYFQVEAKDGSVSTYGDAGSSDSETSYASSVLTWNIKRFKDNMNNPIVYIYEGGLVDNHIKEIRYAYGVNKDDSAYGARFVFDYIERDDDAQGYIAGALVKSTKLLQTIKTYNGSSVPVRIYTLHYTNAPAAIGGYSRIDWVQECSKDTSAANCLPKTTFGWGEPSEPGKFKKALGSVAFVSAQGALTNQAFIDINGNGILDYVWSDYLGNIQYSIDAAVSTSMTRTLTFISKGKAPLFESIDYNADGHQDLLMFNPDTKVWVLYLSVPDPVSKNWILSASNIDLKFKAKKELKVGDLNSDGLADVVTLDGSMTATTYLLGKSGNSETSNNYYAFNSEQGRTFTSQYVPDFTALQIRYNSVRSIEKEIGSIDSVADFNGDGKVDVLATIRHHITYTAEDGSDTRLTKESVEVFVDEGANGFQSKAIVHAGGAIKKMTPDLNGDGLPDVAYLTGDTWKYVLNTGAGFTAPVNLFVSGDKRSRSQNLSFPDINHDGFSDVVWRDSEYVVSDPGVYNDQTETFDGVVAGDIITIYVKYWNPGAGSFTSTSPLLIGEGDGVTKNYDYIFMDVNGDSWVDKIATAKYGKTTPTLMSITGFSNSDYVSDDVPSSGIIVPDQIQTITDGLGNSTTISYAPIGRTSHYLPIGDIKRFGDTIYKCSFYPSKCENVTTNYVDVSSYYRQVNNPFLDYKDIGEGSIQTSDLVDAPVLEVTGPITVVTAVQSTAPTASESAARNINTVQNRVEYKYEHMRMQAAGRGLLGFEYLSTVDTQTGVTTKTRYRQDWPYIGVPAYTTVKTKNENLLSESTSVWKRNTVSNASTKRFQPYIYSSVENTYSLNSSTTTPNLLKTVTTVTEMENYLPSATEADSYGNIKNITVTTSGGGVTQVKKTENKYSSDPWEQRMGRLSTSEVTTTINGSDRLTRKARFDYFGSGTKKGMLWKEILKNDDLDYLTTEYGYDDFGNKTDVKVTGEAEPGRNETRITTYKYDDNGRYLVKTSNNLNQASIINGRDEATGQPTQVTDINSVKGEVFYDSMGKEYLRLDESGAWTRTDTKLCTYSCPSFAKFYTQVRIAGGGSSTTYFDSLGRSVRTSKVDFDGVDINVDTEYDYLGRVKRQSTPFKNNSTPEGWTVNEYDILGRVTKTSLIDKNTTEYSSTSNSYIDNQVTNSYTLDGVPRQRTETRNSLGQLIKVVTAPISSTVEYSYHANGELTTATTFAGDVTQPIVVRMCYDVLGRKTGMLDPDKGSWLATNTDCSALSGSATGWWKYSYNAFGELISQRDAKNQTTSMWYDTLGRMIKRIDEDQTRWFYDKALDGSSPSGSQGKLTAVIVRKNTSEITNCLGTDNCTQYFYDSLARPTNTLVLYPNDSTGYIASVKYDAIGRAYESHDALEGAVLNDSGVQTQFNQYGYAYRTVDIAPVGGGNGVLSLIKSTNERGQVTEEWRGNGATTINTYNPLTGLLERQYATNALGFAVIQDENYRWDSVGNLKYRQNKNANVGSTATKNIAESFCYDGLNRLTTILKNQATTTPSCSSEQDVKYDGLGNITFKKNVGSYQYGSNAGPHAVTSLKDSVSGVVATRYSYDANGNMFNDNERSLVYTSYDMVKSITKGGVVTSFEYGADHARWRRVDNKSNAITTTTYLGNIERIQRPDNTIEWKRNVAGVIYTYKTNSSNQLLNNNTAYSYNDHLGSVDVITNALGKVTHSMSFDPWGARRNADSWADLTAAQRDTLITGLKIEGGTTFSQSITQRGFTGHEMLDDIGIIHMNGRIYDPRLGRFLQADPFIQAAGNAQSYNRYSYVLNNPLNTTDPSGYFSLKQFVGAIVAIVATVACSGNLACGDFAWAWIGAASGAAQAAANGGNILQGALSGLVTAAVFNGIGRGFNKPGGFWDAGVKGGARHIFAHAMAGGILSEVQGGKFGSGFISAGLTKAFDGKFDLTGDGAGEVIAETVVNTVVGGTISQLTGGKFANGAFTAAFQHLFNELGERKPRGTGLPEEMEAKGTSPEIPEEYRAQMQKLGSLATEARNEVDANCSGFCKLPWIRGTMIHKVFADKVNQWSANYSAEISYLDGEVVTYGTKGSVRADAIYGLASQPKFAVDLKTGWFSYVTVPEYENYMKNLPKGVPLYGIKVF